MQFLIYSKNLTDQKTLTLVDFEPAFSDKIPTEITNQGTICLTTGLTFESFRQHFVKAGYCDCGVKGEKMELKRALRFDEKRDIDKPKLLVFNTNSTGAFKRGLNVFYKMHYHVIDPPCLIIIPDVIFDSLKHEGVVKSKKVKQSPVKEQDSILKLMNIPESNPVIKRLEEVYIGDSVVVQNIRALIYRASLSDSPVLILGESGTGKDVIASQIYKNSKSHKNGFFRVNCSAIQESLLEGELFGYVKGIFTSADKTKKGLFAEADGGTLFLDEIGDLSLANQVKILHAIENQEIRQIGSSVSTKIDVRIIAATNRNLDAMMMQGTFRDDLYYRINGFRIYGFPLREHPEDIPLLAKAFWKKKNHTSQLSMEFLNYLKTYQWPGNVRELNSLLNSLVDYFGDIPMKPSHVEAIRKSRQEVLIRAKIDEKDDPAQILKIKSQNVLIEVQNILRSVKIEMRPIIYNQDSLKGNTNQLEKLKKFINLQLARLNELCLEPTYFKRWDLFKKTAKYRHILDNTIINWPESAEQFHSIWTDEIQKLDDDINQGIMEVLWGKIDM